MPNLSFKKLSISIAIVILIASLSAAIFFFFIYKGVAETPGSPISTKTNIEYWGLFESKVVMDQMIAEYQKTHPNININYTQKNEPDLTRYKESLFSRLSGGTGPDIFRMHSTWTPKYVTELSLSNKAISRDEFVQSFYPTAQQQCLTTSGEIVCIPLMHDGLVLLYNIDDFRNNGVSTNIQTWEDLRTAAKKLTRKDKSGELVHSGAALGTVNNVDNFADIIGLMLLQSNVEIPDGFDSREALATYLFYIEFTEEDELWSEKFPNSLDAFATGRTSMAFATSRQILDILNLNSTLNFGVLPTPQVPQFGGQTSNITWANYWVESVSADSSKNVQEESWKFLAWLSQPEQQLRRFDLAADYRKFGEPYSTKVLKNNLTNSPLLGPIVNQAEQSQTFSISNNSGNDSYVELLESVLNQFISSSGRNEIEVLVEFKNSYIELQKSGK